MRIAIISTQYPSDNNHYAHTFVHRRSLYFKEHDIDIEVFVPSDTDLSYQYQGIKVNKIPSKVIAENIKDFDIVYFHLLNLYPFSKRNGYPIYKSVIDNKIKSAFYIHGSEVQSMKSRNFDFKLSLREISRFVYKDLYFMPVMKKVIRKLVNNKCLFITPSKWMLEEARAQLNLPLLEADIIPNGVDTNNFYSFDKKNDPFKLLMIRPLNSNKYAVDIAIKMMSHLPDKYTLDIYGSGNKKHEFELLICKLNLNKRVKFKGAHIANTIMPSIINDYDYFISPTRMDAQGVSMCEALSCGRVVLSSNNTAIPEFITNFENGILAEDEKDAAEKLMLINNNNTLKKSIMDKARLNALKLSFDATLSLELKKLMQLSLNGK